MEKFMFGFPKKGTVSCIGSFEHMLIGSLVIPAFGPKWDTVVEVGSDAFSCRTHISDVELPDGLFKIGRSAFDHCTGLKHITIPGTVALIGDRAFYWCNSLTDVYFRGTKEQWESVAIGEGNDALRAANVHFVG